MKKLGRKAIVLRFLEAFVLLVLLWALASWAMNHRTLPSPYKVLLSLIELVQKGRVLAHISASVFRLLPALVIALGLSMIYVFASYFARRAERISDTMIYFAYPIPKLILLPVIMVLFGLGNGAKIGMIVCVILLQMIVQLRDAIRQVPQSYIDVVATLRGSRRALVRHVLFPAILPDIFSTLRLSIGTAISVLFVTETYGTDKGLGYLIMDQWMRLDYTSMYATIVLLGGMGFALFALVDLIEYFWIGKRTH